MMNRNDPMQTRNGTGDPQAAMADQQVASERTREAVSALFDGEADELELRRILASDQPEQVRGAWRDYQLQRDALAGVDMRFAALDISARVQAALADDAAPLVAVGGARWWRPFASVAVAASVATVVVIGARSFSPSGGFADSNAVAVASTPAANLGRVYPNINPSMNNVAVSQGLAGLSSGGELASSRAASNSEWSRLVFPRNDGLGRTMSGVQSGVQTVGFDADQIAQQRLQQYLLRHTERAALNNGQGVISFSKVSQLNNAE